MNAQANDYCIDRESAFDGGRIPGWRWEVGSKVDFEDQVVIISGAGRRLGRLYACALAELSAKVVVNDIQADRAGRVVAEIEAAGGTAVSSVASVMTETGAASIVETALREFGTVDALIANAGFMRSAYLGA